MGAAVSQPRGRRAGGSRTAALRAGWAAPAAGRLAPPFPNPSAAEVGKLRQGSGGREQPTRDHPLPATSENSFGDAVGFAAEASDGAELQQQSHGERWGTVGCGEVQRGAERGAVRCRAVSCAPRRGAVCGAVPPPTLNYSAEAPPPALPSLLPLPIPFLTFLFHSLPSFPCCSERAARNFPLHLHDVVSRETETGNIPPSAHSGVPTPQTPKCMTGEGR